MRFEIVRADAFGGLVDKKLHLGPGMNVVVGPNESGKSTWHDAVYASLCGLRRGRGAGRKEDQLFAERRRPWSGEEWAVGCIVMLADGRKMDIRQNLDDKVDCRATDVQLGRDVSSEIIFEGSPDGSRWLGLNRQSFLATACVRQAEVIQILEDPDLLQEHLQRAAATAGRDATATEALALLNDFRRERVGQDRRNSTKPLRKALVAAEKARVILDRAQADHRDFLELAVRADEASSRTARLQQDVADYSAALSEREVRQLRERLERARDLSKAFPHGSPPDADPNAHLAREVDAAINSWGGRPTVAPLTGRSSHDIEAAIENLPAMPDGDLEAAPDTTEHYQQLMDQKRRLELHHEEAPDAPAFPDTGDATEQELRTLAGDLEETELSGEDRRLQSQLRTSKAQLAPHWVPALLGVATLSALIVASAFVTAPLAKGGLVLLSLVCGIAFVATLIRETRNRRQGVKEEARVMVVDQKREKRKDTLRRARQLGLPEDATSLRQLADEFRRAQDTKTRADSWTRKEHEIEAVVQQAQSNLLQALEARGVLVGSPSDAAAAFERYRGECAERASIALQAHRREEMKRQLSDRMAAEKTRDEAMQRLEAATNQLREAAVRCGAKGANDAELFSALKSWQNEHRKDLETLESSRQDWAALQRLLGDKSLIEIEEDLEKEEQELAMLRLKASSRTAALSDELDLSAELEARTSEASEARRERDRLDGMLQERASGLHSVPEAEESLAAVDLEVERLKRLDDTLALTIDFMEKAQERVQRDIAPLLASTLKQWLPGITDGRYVNAAVDPDTLTVTVETRDSHWRSARQLSHGTSEIVYLLLRLSMAEHLVSEGEICPLLLDDVTVQCDAERTRHILDLLHDVSRTRQVIFFSQEEEVLRWAEQTLRPQEDRLIRLDPILLEP